MSLDCVCDPAVNSAGDRYSQAIGTFFGDCVYSTTDYISFTAGLITLVLWMFAQFPQLWLNYTLKRVDALSIGLLASWFLGDFTNFLGCILTNQLPTQRYVAGYYVIIDCIILSQFLYYRYFYVSAADAADASELLRLTTGYVSDSTDPAGTTGHKASRSARVASALPMMPYGPGFVPPSPYFSPSVPPAASPATPLEISESLYSSQLLSSSSSSSAAIAQAPSQSSSRARKALYALGLPLLCAGLLSPHLLSETPLVLSTASSQGLVLGAGADASADAEARPWESLQEVGQWERSLLSLPAPASGAVAEVPAAKAPATATAAAASTARRSCRSAGPPRGSFLWLLGPPVAWTSGISYLVSRTPQIALMLSRGTRAAEGLAWGMFATAFVANGLYGLSVLLRLPHIDAGFWASTAPFLLGSLGTMFFDATILILIAKSRLTAVGAPATAGDDKAAEMVPLQNV